MALTLIRQANNYDLSNTYFPHDNKYPAIFQASSDEVNNYIDFKYIFDLYDYTGKIATYETSPSVSSYGTFDASMYIKNKLTYEYNATSGEDITLLLEYRVIVTEYYNGSTHGTATFYSSLMSNRKDNKIRGQLITPYKDISSIVLTDGIGLEISQSRSTDGMGMIINYASNTDIRYKITYANGYVWEFSLNGLGGGYSFSSSTGNALTNADDSGATIPLGYTDLLTASFTGIGYWDLTGTFIADTNPYTGILAPLNVAPSEGIKGKIYQHTDSTKAITFIYYTCETSTIHWVNSIGGFDLFNVNDIEIDSVGLDKKAYQSNNLDTNLFSDNSVADTKQIFTNQTYNISCNTRYLTDDEMQYLKSLYLSEKIYIDLDGTQYPVILKNNEVVVKDTRGELIQYELNFEYAVN